MLQKEFIPRNYTDEWNRLYPDDKKKFHGKDITLLETDVEIAIKVSMVYWKIRNMNEYASSGAQDDNTINIVEEKVNRKNPPNGESERKTLTKKTYNNLN